jgi:class 3 adenylate cyclase
MSPVRRLTAILAADVSGYSRLMGADEEGTHQRLQAHVRELVNPKIREHRRRIVKNTGDGLLAEFASVLDAVRCAVEVQRGMIERNAVTPPEKRIEFRVGINLGDVIIEGEDIFGDGVNVRRRMCVLLQTARAIRGPGSATRRSGDLLEPGICSGRRPGELRQRHRRSLSRGRHLRRENWSAIGSSCPT